MAGQHDEQGDWCGPWVDKGEFLRAVKEVDEELIPDFN